ncbi:hypothetical protein [Novilysobacter defluvii]|uniref:Uncharacterized protein n=1 Tax=Lysobacter defluvii IMMIB APB-9 = DSM 18482 TaxID=1385515 RepID=A0A0A0M8C4_9GAMM|nr:hypothetical protein [Lysobacter defluvii]KGO99278.1 hypothetical protein N791_10365 [Lysobacter defluvii IMMIB APB-9 = DSM 18482]
MTPPIKPGGAQPGAGNQDRSRADHASTHHSAEELREQATAEAGARAEELRESAAHKAESLADSVEAAARELSHDDIGHMSEYVSDLAEQLRHVSGTLREKSGDELLHDVGRLAREKPAVFLAGAVAIGFGLGRFARSSQRPHRNERDQLPVPADQATTHMERTGASGTTGSSGTPTGTASPYGAAGSASGTTRTTGATTPAGTRTTSAPHHPNDGIAGSTLGTGAAVPGSTTGGTSR